MCGQLMPTVIFTMVPELGLRIGANPAEQLGEPMIHIRAQMSDAMQRLANFLQQNRAETLNVAGKPKLPFALRYERRASVYLCRALGRMEEPRVW
jgi:hypothetical protein